MPVKIPVVKLSGELKEFVVGEVPGWVEVRFSNSSPSVIHTGTKGAGKFMGNGALGAYRIHDGGIGSAASVFAKPGSIIETFRAISKSTDTDVQQSVRAELRLKHVAKCVGCLRFAKLQEFYASAREYAADFGWATFPRFLFEVTTQSIHVVFNRLF